MSLRNLVLALLLVLSFILCKAQAPAVQPPAITPMSPELKAFVSRPDQLKSINELSVKSWFQQLPNCTEPKMKRRIVLVDQEPKFDIAGNPLSGQWRLLTWIEGCGEERIVDLQYCKLAATLLLPGTTIASLTLQRDAIFYAKLGMAAIAPKDCKENPVINTSFKGSESEALPQATGAVRRPWMEEWTVRLCGVTGVVPMHFVPDATGTTIHSEVLKAPK